VAGWLITALGWSLAYWNRIYPGVHVAGVDLGGLTVPEAEARLAQAFPYPGQGRVVLQGPDRSWTEAPARLGFAVDSAATARQAFAVGREGPWWTRWEQRLQAWREGYEVPLHVVFSQPWAATYFDQYVRPAVERPAREAVIRLEGTQVMALPGQVGQRLNLDATLALLAQTLMRFAEGPVPLWIDPVPPQILDPEPLASQLRSLLSQPVRLVVPDEPELAWSYSPDFVASTLHVARVPTEDGAAFRLVVDPAPWESTLRTLAAELAREPENARFTFDPETGQLSLLQPAVIGRRLDVDASLQAILQGLEQGQTDLPLKLVYTPPQVTDDATAEELGIRELVAEHTTYFYGSSAARIHNIQTAAARFHGYLVAPGEVFSMAQVLGDVSLDNGYAESLIIYGDRTIRGVGGGVCQVSTTLFRTVFFGGYPIVERHPHAYRVLYYEQTASGRIDPRWAGMDATVYVPLVDFKFKNDTPYWILMEVEVNAPYRYITWRFYSTSDGRKVYWDTTGLQDREDPPPPQYIENPELPKGKIRQVDWAVEGGRVRVLREVYREGELLYRDEFYTHYRPWRAVCEYGPGTPGMPPEDPDPNDPCRPDPGPEDE